MAPASIQTTAHPRTRGHYSFIPSAVESQYDFRQEAPSGSLRELLDSFLHRDPNSTPGCDLLGSFVPRIDVPDHSHAGIIGQDPGQFLCGQFRAVGKRDLTGMDGAANAHPAAMVDGHPRRARSGVDHGVQQRPVRDGVRPVEHRLGLAIRAGNRAAVQMITTDDDRGADLARRDQIVERQAGLVTLAITEPADARRQPLETDLVASAAQPFVQPVVVGKEIHHSLVGGLNVAWVARQRHPAEWALPLAKQRADVSRYEARKLEGAFVATLPGLVTN